MINKPSSKLRAGQSQPRARAPQTRLRFFTWPFLKMRRRLVLPSVSFWSKIPTRSLRLSSTSKIHRVSSRSRNLETLSLRKPAFSLSSTTGTIESCFSSPKRLSSSGTILTSQRNLKPTTNSIMHLNSLPSLECLTMTSQSSSSLLQKIFSLLTLTSNSK